MPDRADQQPVGHPAEAEDHRRRDQHPQQGIQPELVPQGVGDERAEDHEGTVRDVDHPHHPEDQGEAAGDQGVDATDQQAEDEGLDELGHDPGCQPTSALAVATSAGSTTSALPFCHWPIRKSLCGAPVSSHDRGPRMVSTV